jgi:hypothetical protein
MEKSNENEKILSPSLKINKPISSPSEQDKNLM